MTLEFVKELRTFSIIFSCEPMSRSIDECEYASELLQRAANLIDTMNADRETEILHAELNPKKPNCTECAKWDKEQSDNREWIEGVKKGREIVERVAQAVIGKAITEVEPNENHDPIAWINWNAATGERSVNFEQESELASQPLYYTPVTGYDLEEMTELKEERERQRDHAVVEIQKLIARNAELESHMQGLSNEINDFQNTIERQKRELDTIAQQAEPAQKGCDMCKDPDGVLCFPQYGVGPHTCFYKIPSAKMGQSQPLPKDQWPTNYQEDPDCPGMGVYWCPYCGSGKPAPQVAQQAEQGWIDASKQMPPAQVRVLGYEPQYNIVYVDMWFGPDFQWGYSYWMPLPAAPKGGV